MTVYVDDMYRSTMGNFRNMKMSHLVADNEEELHAMAAAIGVARKWYQGDHYDIAMGKRALALAHGAVAVTMRQCAAIRWCFDHKVDFHGDPQEAWARRIAAMKGEVLAAGPLSPQQIQLPLE